MVGICEFPKFRSFTESTKLHGIPRVGEGSKLSIAFWAVLVVISVGMAINDLYVLVNNYRSDQTAIQVSLAKSDNFTWPTPTLCMEILVDYKDWVAVPLYFEAPQLFNDRIDKFVNQYYQLVVGGNYNNVSYMYPDGYNNPNLLYYPYIMLGYLIELEQKLMGQNDSYLRDNQFNIGNNDPKVSQRAQVFYDAFNKRNVSMAEMTQAIGMWFCLKQLTGQKSDFGNVEIASIYGQFENFRYFGDPEYIKLPLCKASMITHLGFGMVCSKVFETPNVPFVQDYTQFEIYDTHFTMGQQAQNQLRMGTAALVPSFRWHLDLLGRNVIPTGDKTNIFSWNPRENVVLEASVVAEYQFINSRRKSCSNSPLSQYDCIWQKRVEFVYDQCGCWPSLADIKNQRNDVNCSVNSSTPLTIYNLSVGQFCPNAQLFQPDWSDCIEDCNLMNFSFTQYPARKTLYSVGQGGHNRWGTMNTMANGHSIQFRFSAASSYILISESFTTDWSAFLSAWGGSIGTWLGASLLAFFHIPIFIVSQYCLPKPKPKSLAADSEGAKAELE